MQIREWMNNNSAAVTIGAIVLLLVALGVLAWQTMGGGGGGGGTITELYYYDVGTGEIMTAPREAIAPIPGKGGTGEAVKAYIFSCGDCPRNLAGMKAADLKAQGAFLGYLEKYTPQGKQQLEQATQNNSPEAMMMMEMQVAQVLIRRPEGGQWIPSSNPAASDIMRSVYSGAGCPDGKRPNVCYPN